jgi:hypothetical protein
MPKLTRLYLAGLGHKDAKFNPLDLKFTNAKNVPAHTLLWLPNGGGKSLLIAFKYAALRPSKHDFLGRRTGRGADLEDFVPPGKLAVVLLELDFTEAGGERRVIGYAAVRREQGLDRVFFSFRSHPTLAWESLPLPGRSQALPNLKKLIEHFRVADQKDRARISFFETQSQTDWETHLRDDVKLDPEIFHHHLVMNSDEGGVTKLFAKKTTDEFIQLFLQLALEGESIYRVDADGERVDQVRQLVADYKRAFHQNPKRELTRKLCDDLIPVLKLIHANVERRGELASQMAKAEAEGTLLLCSIAAKREVIAKDLGVVEGEITALTTVMAELRQAKLRNGEWADGYELLRKRLYFEETDSRLIDVASAQSRCEREVRVLEAARAAAVARAATAGLKAVEDERRAKLAALEPELVAIKALGGKLHWILAGRNDRLEADGLQLEKDFSKAHERQVSARTQKGTASAALKSTRRSLEEVRLAQSELKDRRQKLRADGLADEGETAVAAAKRWKDSVQEFENATIAMEGEQGDWRDREDDASRRESTAKLAGAEHVAKRNATEALLIQWRDKVQAFQALPAVRAISGGTDISVWNESVSPALADRAANARAAALDAKISGSDDERTLQRYQPPDRPLFPAPLDLEIVREILKRNGIHAVDAYAHLDAAHQQTSTAESQLRMAPAEWSGLVIGSKVEFDRARQLVQEAPVSRPVSLVFREWIVAPPVAGSELRHVVVPTNRGMWNKAMARADVHEVARRKELNGEAIVRAEKEEFDNSDALRSLQQLQRGQTREQVAGWEAALAENDLDIARESDNRRRAEDDRQTAKAALEEIGTKLRATRDMLRVARTNNDRLQQHIARYEERAEEWNRTEVRLADDEKRLVDEQADAEREVSAAEEALRPFPERRLQLVARGAALQAERDRLPADFVGDSVEPAPDETAETLWPRFEADVRTYQKTSTDEGLNVRIDLARSQNRDAQTALSKATKGLTANEWAPWTARDDLASLLESAHGKLKAGESEVVLARQAHAIAAAAWPESERMSRGREKIDQKRTASLSIDAEVLRDECRSVERSAERQREEKEEELGRKRDVKGGLRELEPKYAAIAARCPEGIVGAESGAHRDFVGEITADQKLAERIFQAVKEQRRFRTDAEEAARKLFTEQWVGVLAREDYTRKPVELRDKITSLSRGEIEHDPQKHLKSITGIRDACDNEITQLATQRSSLVQHLSQRAALAAKRLKALQTESYLPKELEAWGGRPFLTVDLKIGNDETERTKHLGELVEKWAREGDEEDIPAGHVLAFACLKATLATNGATLKILKPTQRLECFYHDITELTGFSEGQRVTAAILIYSILVKLRQRQVGTLDGMPLDAGYLLLDNPLGKANHTALVDLQLRVGKAMGLQLVYASGINDPGALVHFDHIVRLKNTALDSRTGDKLVQVDQRAGEIHAVEVGVHPRQIIPPAPAMPSSAPAPLPQ